MNDDPTPAEPPVPAAAPEAGEAAVASVAIALLALEIALVALVIRGAWVGWALAGHAAAAALLGGWILATRRCADLRPRLLLGVTFPFLGPVAAAGALVQWVCAGRFARSALPIDEWYARLCPEPVPDPGLAVHERLRGRMADRRPSAGAAPLLEVMLAGTREQKQALLTMAGRDYRPVFASALQQALRDEDGTVRVQAAATVAKIEGDLHRRTVELGARLRERPGDPGAVRELARLHGDLSLAGWLDESRRDAARDEALRLYGECLRSSPWDEDLRLAVGELLLRAGRAAEAADWFEEGLAHGCNSARSLFAHAAGLFEAGRFDEARRLVSRRLDRMPRPGELPAHALETLEYWRAKGLLAPPEEHRP